jgi:GNAT superfamily N-acetyltransferase
LEIKAALQITWREEPQPSDMEHVREIVVSSGFFSEAEIEVAVELVQERLNKGIESGYHFLFAEKDREVAGYSCFGPIPCTVESYDIYWIAVQEELRGSGLGAFMLKPLHESSISRPVLFTAALDIARRQPSRTSTLPGMTKSFISECFDVDMIIPPLSHPPLGRRVGRGGLGDCGI